MSYKLSTWSDLEVALADLVPEADPTAEVRSSGNDLQYRRAENVTWGFVGLLEGELADRGAEVVMEVELALRCSPAWIRNAGALAAQTFQSDFPGENPTGGWIGEAFQIDSQGLAWPDNAYADLYEPAFRAELAKIRSERA